MVTNKLANLRTVFKRGLREMDSTKLSGTGTDDNLRAQNFVLPGLDVFKRSINDYKWCINKSVWIRSGLQLQCRAIGEHTDSK